MNPLAKLFYAHVCFALVACQSTKPITDKKAKELPYGGRSQPLSKQSEIEIASGTNDQDQKPIFLSAIPLTLAGDNTEPTFSRDGVKVLFISRERPEHHHAQVYELTLNPLRERRVTYHDGDDASPIYHPDGARLIYSSTTDNLKNDPVFIENLQKVYLSQSASVENAKAHAKFDLFSSRLDGREISHILPYTLRHDASEVSSTLDPKGRLISYSSVVEDKSGEKSDIYLLPLSGGSARKLSNDRELDSHPKFSADGKKLIWIKNVPTGAQIFTSEQPFTTSTPLTQKIARYLTAHWHPNGEQIIFSSDRGGEGNLDLYIYGLKTKCLTQVTRTASDESAPVFSPDGKKLAFVSNQSGRNQIYLVEFKDELAGGKFCLSDAL